MFDSQFSKLLTVTVQFLVTFSSLLVEYQYFVSLYQRRYYFAYHFCTFYCRSTYCDSTVVVYQQNFVKFNSCTVFSVLNVVYKQLLAFFCLELLTVNFYDYVHCYLYIKRVSSARWIRLVESLFYPHGLKSGAKIWVFIHITNNLA